MRWGDPRSGRGDYHPSRPGDEITEARAADGIILYTAAEKRGLYNLIVPAPTTPEMIRKEKRQDNDELYCISLYRTYTGSEP